MNIYLEAISVIHWVLDIPTHFHSMLSVLALAGTTVCWIWIRKNATTGGSAGVLAQDKAIKPITPSDEVPFPWASVHTRTGRLVGRNKLWKTMDEELRAEGCKPLAEAITSSADWKRMRLEGGPTGSVRFEFNVIDTARQCSILRYEVRCKTGATAELTDVYLVDRAEFARQERNLKTLRDQFDKAFLRNPAAMVISTIRSGKILAVNESFEGLTGHQKIELLGAEIHDLKFYEDPSQRERLSLKLHKQGFLENEEIQANRKDGKLLHLLASAEPIEFEGETAILSTLLDITEWRQAELRLLQSEKFLRNTLNALPNQVAILDATGAVIETNDTWNRFHRNLTVCPHDQCHRCREHLQTIGTIAGLTPPAIRSLEKELLEISAEAGRSTAIEYAIAQQGHARWIACRVQSFMDDGQVRVAIIQDDITHRKEADIKIREAEERYRQIFEHAAEGIFQSTPEGRLMTANPAMARIFGYDSPLDMLTIVSQVANQLYADPAQRDFLLDRLHRDGRVSDLEETYRKKDGNLIRTRSNVRGVFDESGRLLYMEGTLIDITERQKMHEALQSYTRELEKTNYELDRFVYSVSHDLRAPITSMMGLINLMELVRTPEEGAGHVAMMRRCITRLDYFIRQILQYAINARQEPLNELTDLRSLLNQVCEQLNAEDGRQRFNLGISFDGPEMVNIDRSRVEIILVNLVSNAVKYKKEDQARADIHVHIKKSERQLEINVCDQGIGIPPDTIDHVFDMFFRSNHQLAGSGLGLYLVRETVRRMKGKVVVSSIEGESTCFLVTLPINTTNTNNAYT